MSLLLKGAKVPSAPAESVARLVRFRETVGSGKLTPMRSTSER